MANPTNAWICHSRHLHATEVEAVTCEVRRELGMNSRLTRSLNNTQTGSTFEALLAPVDVKTVHVLIGRVVEAVERERTPAKEE